MYKIILIGIISLFIINCSNGYQMSPYSKLIQSKIDPTLCYEFIFNSELSDPVDTITGPCPKELIN